MTMLFTFQKHVYFLLQTCWSLSIQNSRIWIDVLYEPIGGQVIEFYIVKFTKSGSSRKFEYDVQLFLPHPVEID